MKRQVPAVIVLLLTVAIVAMSAGSNSQQAIAPPDARSVEPQTAAQPLKEEPKQVNKAPQSMTSFIVTPSPAWLDQFKNESVRDVQVFYNLATLLDAIRQQQAQIKALQSDIAALKERMVTLEPHDGSSGQYTTPTVVPPSPVK
jgi:hypothetical protein